MKMLSSDWLKRMVTKSAPSPEARIVQLFVILQDWVDAPGIREQLLPLSWNAEDHRDLNAFLLSLVTDANLAEPEKLAFQLTFILTGALSEERRNPGEFALQSAGEAAVNLIASAKTTSRSRGRKLAAVSIAMAAVIAGIAFVPVATSPKPALFVPESMAMPASNVLPVKLRPDQLAAIYRMNENLRKGQCSYPQALMLAADQRAVFLEGVVNINDLDTVHTDMNQLSNLYQKVDCSYAPAAMLL